MKKPKNYQQQIITKKKKIYPVNKELENYLAENRREIKEEEARYGHSGA